MVRIISLVVLSLSLAHSSFAQAKKGGGGGWDFEDMISNPNSAPMLMLRESIKKNAVLEFRNGEERTVCKVDGLATSIAQTLATKPDLTLVEELLDSTQGDLQEHQRLCLKNALAQLSKGLVQIQNQFIKP
jgi:hypothetical protein